MRVVNTGELVPVIERLVIKSCHELDRNVIDSLRGAAREEESPLAKEILNTLLDNAEIARKEGLACCQDTGIAVIFLEIGQQVAWEGDPLRQMVDEGVRQGYENGYLRKSVLNDPILRQNRNDNTPAVLHIKIVPGDKIKITVMPKGGGSENMSRAAVLTPADGAAGVKKYVLESVRIAGGKACPPFIVGVGIGGTMEKAALMAKESLGRTIGERNKQDHIARLEDELLREINRLGIGTLGIGGSVTALDVHIDAYPCHIASLPIAVNLQCHASRHACEQL